jgi:4-diphosphocytidyl-2-C-methyl-D-erythritol kinase
MSGGAVGQIPSDGKNLCVRAAEALLHSTNRQDLDVSIVLEKQIPAGGGFGGGSSNAAAVLSVLHAHLGEPLAKEELFKIALSLGADVPYFLSGCSTVRVQGIGEQLLVERANYLRGLPVLLVLGLPHLSTADVFHEAAHSPEVRLPHDQPSTSFPDTYTELLEIIENDLEAPATSLCPALLHVLTELRSLRCGVIGMTGSGSGLFVLPKNSAGFESHEIESVRNCTKMHGVELAQSAIVSV